MSMKSVKFGNRKALEIIDTDLKKQIKDILWEKAKTRPMDKNYRILNEGSVQHLQKYPHLVGLSTYGKKFILSLIKIDGKNHTIFVDRKKEMMIYMPMGFDKSLYTGTIFDGELMKNNEGRWIYFINDVLLHNGKPTFMKQLEERIKIVKNILENQFESNNLDFCLFEMKQYFEYKHIKDLSNGYQSRLNYKCSGLIFKNCARMEKCILYIFPENRTKTNISDAPGVTNGQIFNGNSSSSASTIQSDKPRIKTIPKSLRDDSEFIGENRIFLMKSTNLPDVYDLFAKDKQKELHRVGLAGITSLEVSQKINEMLNDKDTETGVNVECHYIPRFKKWEPVGLSDEDVYLLDN